MILIADSGSTKCDWVLMDSNKNIVSKTITPGINPLLLNIFQISDILFQNKILTDVCQKVSAVLFYGAGCGGMQARSLILKILKEFFSNAKVSIEEDLMAAVHGTTTSPGVVCILGTGSNCCYYDGKRVHIYQDSLGFMVMDEGSGNYFGKQLLNTYFYNRMPDELLAKFESSFELDLESVLENLYNKENPSGYLASFTPFLIENRKNPFIKDIIERGIKKLFDNLISCYNKELADHPLHFVGSIAFYLQDSICEEARERRIKIRSFVKRPMDNIIRNINI